MDIADYERLIAKISWGYIPATISTKDGQLVSLLLRTPTPEEQARAAIIYSIELQRANIIGLPCENEVLENLTAVGQWNQTKEDEILGLQKDIHTIRRGLLDLIFNTSKLEQARSLLRRAEKALIERLYKKHSLLQTSAEAHAEICQQQHIISCVTETEDGKSFWKTKDEFDQCDDQQFIQQLCEAFFEKSRISIKTIRELARSQPWRLYWEIAKETNDLFSGPVISWSLNQKELAYWSNIYDSVYNAFERPSKEIIEDDDLLDSWFIRQGEKIEQRSKSDTMPAVNNKPGQNETFIMTDKKGAERVYQLNDPASRAKIKARQKLINTKGKIAEQYMPDSQQAMKQQLTEMQRKHVKNIDRK